MPARDRLAEEEARRARDEEAAAAARRSNPELQARYEAYLANRARVQAALERGDLGAIGWRDENGDGIDDATELSFDELVNRAFNPGGDAGFVDSDGDSVDDNTGMLRGEFVSTTKGYTDDGYSRSYQTPSSNEAERWFGGTQTTTATPAGDTWRDANSDGRHDITNEARGSFDSRVQNYAPNRNRRAQEAASAQQLASEQARFDQEAEAYRASGQRAADLDAGKPDRYAPNKRPGYTDPYDPVGAYKESMAGGGAGRYPDGTPNYTGNYQADQFLASLTGDNAAQQISAAMKEARRRAETEDLRGRMYNPEDLFVDHTRGMPESSLYETDAGSEAAQGQLGALRALQDVYQSGGMTQADRARMQLSRMETGMAMRGQREADQQALNARGMGNSGQSIASMLGAQATGANSLAAADATMNINAQERALQAMQQAASASQQARQQNQAGYTAMDAFNWDQHGMGVKTQQDQAARRRQGYLDQVELTRMKLGMSKDGRAEDLEDESDADREDVVSKGVQAIGNAI